MARSFHGQLNSNIDDVIKEATLFISDCYEFHQESMTKFRIMPWYTQKTKARKTAPPLQFLSLTDESFKKNVKRAHLQAIVWYATMEANPPVDPTLYGWRRDELYKDSYPSVYLIALPPLQMRS